MLAEAKRIRIAKATLLGCAMLTVMAGATIAPALPGIKRHFYEELGPDAMIAMPFGIPSLTILQFAGLLLTLPGLTVAMFGPIAGLLGDRLGRVPVLAACVILYVASGSSGLFLEDPIHLLIGRALLGVAVGGIMTSTTALVADLFHGKARQEFMGMQGAFMSYGGFAFVSMGGALSDISWRGPFIVYALALVLLPGMWLALRGCQSAASEADAPLLPPNLPWGQIILLYITAFVLMASFYIMPTQLPSVLQGPTWGASGTVTGLIIGAVSAIGGMVALNFGRVRRKLSNPSVLLFNIGLMGLGLVLVGLAELRASWIELVAGLVVIGLGSGLGMANMNEWMTGIIPPEVRGRVLGGLTTAIFLGSFASPLFVSKVIEQHGQPTGWISAGIVVLILTAIVVPIGFWLRRRHHRAVAAIGPVRTE